jgi:anti-anti-sigma factor
MVCVNQRDELGEAGKLVGVTVEYVTPGVRIVAARGELDVFTSPEWREALLAQLTREDCRVLVVDLNEVGFAGAVIVNVLLEAHAAGARAGTELRLVLGRQPRRLLELLGVAGRFSLYARRADAFPAAVPAAREPLGGDR